MGTYQLNFSLLATDYVRTIKVPETSFRKPLCIVLVGYPGSGKTLLVEKLAEKLPLTVLSEKEITAFLAPKATLFKRGSLEVFSLALETMVQLMLSGKACIYDGNIKIREQRELVKRKIEAAGGTYRVIAIKTPKEICYERVQKQNLAITGGNAKGFILDKDYFEYEATSTRLPTPEEQHTTYTGQDQERLLRMVAVVENLLRVTK
jgi:predicted kinase